MVTILVMNYRQDKVKLNPDKKKSHDTYGNHRLHGFGANI